MAKSAPFRRNIEISIFSNFQQYQRDKPISPEHHESYKNHRFYDLPGKYRPGPQDSLSKSLAARTDLHGALILSDLRDDSDPENIFKIHLSDGRIMNLQYDGKSSPIVTSISARA